MIKPNELFITEETLFSEVEIGDWIYWTDYNYPVMVKDIHYKDNGKRVLELQSTSKADLDLDLELEEDSLFRRPAFVCKYVNLTELFNSQKSFPAR